MPLVPFVPFIISLSISTYAIQSSAITAILLAALVFAAYKKKLKIPFAALPYILFPLLLLASINRKLEFASNDALQCFSMLAGTILIFSQKELYSKWLFRTMLICGNLHLAVQTYAIIASKLHLTVQILGTVIGEWIIGSVAAHSFFPLANEIMFFYMLVAFSSVFAFCKESGFWKKYAATIGSLAFASIILGDPATIGKITSEDAVGIWLGLACGALFSLALFLWKKLNLPKTPAISISALIFLAMMLAPVLAVNFPIFSKNARGEALTRLVNWQAAWDLVKENPFGVGFGAYGANIMQHWPTMEEAYTVWPGTVFIAAHNQYLQILTEIGWLGLLYYSALFALPWFIAIFRYLKTGELRFLFIAGTLAAVLSVMEVSEAMSMFAFIQIIHWCFLIYCVKAAVLSGLPPPRLLISRSLQSVFVLPALPQSFRNCFNIRFLYVLPLLPLVAYLLFDRGKQLYSMTFTAPIDHFVPVTRKQYTEFMENANKAHPKNSSALWHIALLHAMDGENTEALKAADAFEEVSGHVRPISNLRMEIYINMGDRKKACEIGNFVFNRFADDWTLRLKKELNGCR